MNLDVDVGVKFGRGYDLPPVSSRYKWTALSNTTLGTFMATLDSSIVIISLPAIFRGIQLDPLEPSNISYLLWMLMGYLVCTAVLVVTFGRLGDIFGRVRMYNAASRSSPRRRSPCRSPQDRRAAATYLIVMRIVQGVGGAMLLANATAIITDAFPVNERGKAMGSRSPSRSCCSSSPGGLVDPRGHAARPARRRCRRGVGGDRPRMTAPLLTIGRAADQAGVTTRTLRYYERWTC